MNKGVCWQIYLSLSASLRKILRRITVFSTVINNQLLARHLENVGNSVTLTNNPDDGDQPLVMNQVQVQDSSSSSFQKLEMCFNGSSRCFKSNIVASFCRERYGVATAVLYQLLMNEYFIF